MWTLVFACLILSTSSQPRHAEKKYLFNITKCYFIISGTNGIFKKKLLGNTWMNISNKSLYDETLEKTN